MSSGCLGYRLSRRTMLGGAGLTGVALTGSGLLGAAPALAASLIREEGIPTDPAARIAMIRRMRLRTDPGIVYWWFRGRNYAQQGAKLTPLCELVFGAVMMFTMIVMPRGLVPTLAALGGRK